MQKNEYKQNYKVLVIKGLYNFFYKYKPTIWNNYKNIVSRWFTLYKPTQSVIISEETPPHPLNSTKSAR